MFKFILAVIFMLSTLCYANEPSLENLSMAEANAVSKEFSANFIHTTVSSAAPLGDIFGFEVGVIGGFTDSPEIDALSKRVDPSASDIDKLPHAALYGAVSVPLGFTVEANLIPGVDINDVELEHFSLGVKWTFSKFLDLPFDAALRVHGAKSSLGYEDNISGVDTDIEFDTTTTGFNFSISKKFLVFEPYIGIGRVSADTDISASGTVNLLGFMLPDSQNFESKNSGTHFFLGANVNLFIFKAGIEYTKLMSLERFSGKLSFYF